MAADWLKIKNEYISTGISQRKLADKYGVSISTLTKKATIERWSEQREKQCSKIEAKVKQKTQDRIVEGEVRKIDRKYELSERLLDKLEQAISELDLAMVTNKHKTRTIEYKDNTAIGKPTKEIIDEREEILRVSAIVDRSGVKQLASALKDIKDIQTELSDRADKVNGDNAKPDPLSASLEELAGEIDGGRE